LQQAPDNETALQPDHLLNRELSWLEFNQRVLDEALDRATPLLDLSLLKRSQDQQFSC